MPLDPTPRFTSTAAEQIALGRYGISGTATPLPSERDQNFSLKAASGEKFVLKIAKADEERSILDFQNAALRHAAEHDSGLAISRVLPTLAGEEITTVRDEAGRSFLTRLVTWLEGDVFVHVGPHDGALLASLGVALGSLDAALADFQHPAMHRQLHWDLKRIALALQHVPLLSPEQRSIVQHFKLEWEKVPWPRLRTSVIHGDANDYNVLVREGKVAGFLDFGDMVHSATVCDLAIALAYALLDKTDPLASALTIASAYHRCYPLEAVEIDSLYPLMTSRLCMSVCYAAHNARAKSDDAYQLVTAAPAWKLLHRLRELPASKVREAFGDQLEVSA